MSAPKTKRRARHAAKDHLPKWMLEHAAKANELLAASPYITDGRLFKGHDTGFARLYMDFGAINFVTGASSLRVLKKLHSSGVAVYHVSFLHAKIVMVDKEHFSIGCQNLTVRSRRKNVEASFVAGSDTPTKEVQKFFKLIHDIARPIQMADLLEMERLIAPCKRKFKEIAQISLDIDRQVELARIAREEEERAKRAALELAKREAEELALRKANRVSAGRSEMMKRALSLSRSFLDQTKLTATNHLNASVRKLINTGPWRDVTSTNSLVPLYCNRNFEQLLAAVGIAPKQFSRYLVINMDDGKLGLVRFAKTQWTFFGSGVRPTDRLFVGDVTWKVEIEFDWTPAGVLLRNGIAHLRGCYDDCPRVASIGFAFSITGIELSDLSIATHAQLGNWGFILEVCKIDVTETKNVLKTYLLRHLTVPFKFKHNLYGRQAFDFFGHYSVYQIQAHRLGQTAIFSARRCS
jgi:hypothetical protein